MELKFALDEDQDGFSAQTWPCRHLPATLQLLPCAGAGTDDCAPVTLMEFLHTESAGPTPLLPTPFLNPHRAISPAGCALPAQAAARHRQRPGHGGRRLAGAGCRQRCAPPAQHPGNRCLHVSPLLCRCQRALHAAPGLDTHTHHLDLSQLLGCQPRTPPPAPVEVGAASLRGNQRGFDASGQHPGSQRAFPGR